MQLGWMFGDVWWCLVKVFFDDCDVVYILEGFEWFCGYQLRDLQIYMLFRSRITNILVREFLVVSHFFLYTWMRVNHTATCVTYFPGRWRLCQQPAFGGYLLLESERMGPLPMFPKTFKYSIGWVVSTCPSHSHPPPKSSEHRIFSELSQHLSTFFNMPRHALLGLMALQRLRWRVTSSLRWSKGWKLRCRADIRGLWKVAERDLETGAGAPIFVKMERRRPWESCG